MVDLAGFHQMAERISNWGRWGPQDEAGTLNLITEEVRLRGARSVQSGAAFSLAMPLSLNGPQDGSGVPGRINPVRTMLVVNSAAGPHPEAAAYSDDIVTTPIQAATHWDALSHVSHRGKMYNDVPAGAVTAAGASRLGIDPARRVLSRGVLLDLPKHLGLKRLPGGFEVTSSLLAECERAQGDIVLPGDILLIRTGHMQLFLGGDIHGYHTPTPGLGISAAEWFRERDVSAVATDTIAFELLPSPLPEVVLPVHVLCLVMLGLLQGQNFVLEDLAAACAQDGRYSFLLNASPEPFVNSTGGMVNPVALR